MPLLSRTAEYALRAMAVLARLPPGSSIRAVDLAEATGIPVHYLSKIMRRLGIERLVDARKGHGGGFRLRRPAAKIQLRHVLEAVEDAAPQNCGFGWTRCSDVRPCPLHPAWSRLRSDFEDWAKSTTLADLGS